PGRRNKNDLSFHINTFHARDRVTHHSSITTHQLPPSGRSFAPAPAALSFAMSCRASFPFFGTFERLSFCLRHLPAQLQLPWHSFGSGRPFSSDRSIRATRMVAST